MWDKEGSLVTMVISEHVKQIVSVLEVYDFTGIHDLTPEPTSEILIFILILIVIVIFILIVILVVIVIVWREVAVVLPAYLF